MGIDWAALSVYVLIALSGAASSLAAYLSHRQLSAPLASVSLQLGSGDGSPLPESSPVDLAVTILPWRPAYYLPNWSQSNAFLPDGSRDSQWYNDCGETCVAMVIAGVWGCPVEPGAIRQRIHGVAGIGLTDSNDLVTALKGWSVKAHTSDLTANGAWELVVSTLASQRPVIVLGRWPSAGGALHWMVAVSNGAGTLNCIDPINEVAVPITRPQWGALYANQLVVLDSHVHFDCRAWSDPS